MCRGLVACLLFGVLIAASHASAASDDVTFALDPDPPVAGTPFTVVARFATDASDVTNVTLKACAYDRASKAATVCLLPAEMARLGPSEFSGATDPRASVIFEAGGAVGINISYVDASGAHRDFPGDGRDYILFDIVENPVKPKTVPAPGGVFVVAGIAVLALVWRAGA